MYEISKIDRSEALRYLACKDNSCIDATTAEYIDECEKKLLNVISPKAVYRYFPLNFGDGMLKADKTALILEGESIKSHLHGCNGIVCLAATLGNQTDKLIRLFQVENMAKAVIADALANVAIEQLCEQAEQMIFNDFPQKYFTWRFSPGYDDFPLETQRILLDSVDAPRKIGLCTSSSFVLTPIKSVTAVIGISDTPLPQKIRGCITCSLNRTCQFRKRGTHCGF